MTTANRCDSANISVTQTYSKVCGRIAAYAFGGPDAFANLIAQTPGATDVGEPFVDGVVLYYGTPLINHIWTFAVGSSEDPSTPQGNRQLCNCDVDPANRISPPTPPFVGEDYFCESQNSLFPSSGTDPTEALW